MTASDWERSIAAFQMTDACNLFEGNRMATRVTEKRVLNHPGPDNYPAAFSANIENVLRSCVINRLGQPASYAQALHSGSKVDPEQ
jgi:hypothetical protein